MPTWSPPGAPVSPVSPKLRDESSSRERTGRFVFWFGLLGVFLASIAEYYTTSNLTLYRIVDGLVVLGYVAVLAVTGWLHRRGSAVLPAILLALAGIELVLPDLSLSIGTWFYTNAALLEAAAFTLLFAAWLGIRRTTGAAWVALLPVAAVEYVVTRYVAQLLFDALPGAVAVIVGWPLIFVGGTALLALAALVVARLSRKGPRPSPNSASPYAPVAAPSQAPVSAPPWAYGPPPGSTNTLAIIALVLGIIGVSLGGIICGHIALSQIKRTGETGRGMAIAGLVLGYLWVAVVVISFIALASAASSSGY